MWGIPWLAEERLPSQVELCSVESVMWETNKRAFSCEQYQLLASKWMYVGKISALYILFYEVVSKIRRTMLITRKSLARVCCGGVLWVSVPSGVVGCGSVWLLHVSLCVYCMTQFQKGTSREASKHGRKTGTTVFVQKGSTLKVMEEFNIQGKQTSFYKYCHGSFGYTLLFS